MADLPELSRFNKIVVKVGSSLLVDRAAGALKQAWLDALVEDIAALHARGADVLVVSSGAIALGRTLLGLPKGALKLEDSQAAAAVGQIALARAWSQALHERGIVAGQVLLTLNDTEERRRYLNARETLARLSAMRAIPVINENDTVATSEIRYGDNDRLAARVATMASADLLILLSDIEGLYTAPPKDDPDARADPAWSSASRRRSRRSPAAAASELSRGGMRTKIEAARIATQAGTHMVIADGRVLHPDRARRRAGALHLVPDALDAAAGAQSVDRRHAGDEGRGHRRRRRGARAGPRQEPAAGRRHARRGRVLARRLRGDPRRSAAPRSAAASSPTTRCTPSASAAATRATSPQFSARRAGPR